MNEISIIIKITMTVCCAVAVACAVLEDKEFTSWVWPLNCAMWVWIT